MPTMLSTVFRSITQPPTLSTPHLPMINSIANNLANYLSAFGQITKKQQLVRWFKSIPELTALASKVAKDIVYKYHFENVKPEDSGRNKILQANKFAQQVQLTKLLLSQAVDMLVTGEAFGWLGKVKDEQIKQKIAEIVSHHTFLETKEDQKEVCDNLFTELKQVEGFADLDKVDEDLLRPRKYRHIASSTIQINHDQFEIVNYKHVVGASEVYFKPEEIIHFTFIDFDGKVNGFTPVESVIVQLELLRQMWQNMLSVHKNGGSPDKLFVLENTQVNSPAYKRIEAQLGKYKLVENKHGNMLFTGKVSVEDLQQLDQMQFKDMGLYITGLVAMQWQIPRSSIPYIVGGTNTQEDTGGNSEKGYWRNVEYAQSVFVETMNTQLWIPYFGVRIVFDNTFVQQDVQIQTGQQLKLGNIVTTDNLLKGSGKQLSLTKKLKLLGLTINDIEDVKIMDIPIANPTTLNNQPSKAEVNDTDAKKNVKDRKRQEQTDLADRGMASITGVGKELDVYAELEYKQLIGTDDKLVDLPLFVEYYEKETVKPKIFMRQNNDNTTFRFKSQDVVYKTSISNMDIENKKQYIVKLCNNIYKL